MSAPEEREVPEGGRSFWVVSRDLSGRGGGLAGSSRGCRLARKDGPIDAGARGEAVSDKAGGGLGTT